MTTEKQFKRQVRERQMVTGEPYTLARRNLLADQADPRLSAAVDGQLWKTLADQIDELVPDEPTLLKVAAALSIDGRPDDETTWTGATIAVAQQHRTALCRAVVAQLALHIPAEWCAGRPVRPTLETQAQRWDPTSTDPFDRKVVRAAIALADRFGDSRAQVTDPYPIHYPCGNCDRYDVVTMVDCDWPAGVTNGDLVTGHGWHCSDPCHRGAGDWLS